MMFRIPETHYNHSTVHAAPSSNSLTSRSWSRFSGPYCPRSLIPSYSVPSCGILSLCQLPTCMWDDLCVADTEYKEMSTASTPRNVNDMRTAELKEELESYGVATRGLFEKAELEEALLSARIRLPKPDLEVLDSKKKALDTKDELLQAEIKKVSTMKSSQIRKELQNRFNMNTIFFEKSEYILALARARVDEVIEVKDLEESSSESASSSFFAPFSGLSNTMQNIQTVSSLLQNAQQLISNPEAAKVLQKYQSNPKVMSAVMDCMNNPTNFSKYQSDPEVTKFLDELAKCV